MYTFDPRPQFEIPFDLYYVLRHPAPLAGMRMPFTYDPWQMLYEHGFRWVVALERGLYNPRPLKVGCVKYLHDMLGKRVPNAPDVEKKLIGQAVDFVVQAIEKDEGVIVHCMGGRGRTGTVLGCAMKRLGYMDSDSLKIIKYLDNIHKSRGRSGWPESRWQAEVIRSYIKSSSDVWSFGQ